MAVSTLSPAQLSPGACGQPQRGVVPHPAARGDKRPIRPGARPPSHANVRRAVTPPPTHGRPHPLMCCIPRTRGTRMPSRGAAGEGSNGRAGGGRRSVGGASRTSGVWHGSASTGRVCVSSLPRSSSARFGAGAVRGLGQRGRGVHMRGYNGAKRGGGDELGCGCGCGEALGFGLQWWACLVGGRWMVVDERRHERRGLARLAPSFLDCTWLFGPKRKNGTRARVSCHLSYPFIPFNDGGLSLWRPRVWWSKRWPLVT
jgi:hypothetical protein